MQHVTDPDSIAQHSCSIVGAVQHRVEQAQHSFKRWPLGCGSQLWPAISTQAAILIAVRPRRLNLACVMQWVQSEISHASRPVELWLFTASAVVG